MLIQDMNHIEVASEEIVGGTGNTYNNSFSSFNGFTTDINNFVNLGGAASATAGSGATAQSNRSLLVYTKNDAGARVTDGFATGFATAAAAIQYH
jgi:hypothetical protein